MKEKTYGIFLFEDKVLSIKTEQGWEFPSTTESTCWGNYDPFKEIILSEYIRDNGVFGRDNLSFYDSKTADIQFAAPTEYKWVGREGFAGVDWNPNLLNGVRIISEMFNEQAFKITEKNPDGTEELMWSGICNDFVWQREFYRLIMEQGKTYHAPDNTAPWRQIRAYNENGDLIRTES